MKCNQCGGCCKHIALEIDKPSSKEDYNNILWYLLHNNVSVFVDEGDWFVEFRTRCKALNEENTCNFYEKRPKICRTYSSVSCVRNGHGEPHDFSFGNAEEFLKYMEENNIDYTYKNWKK